MHIISKLLRVGRLFRNRWVRRFCYAQLAFIVFLVIFFFSYRGVLSWRGHARVDEWCQRLDAEDPRWRWADIDADRVAIPDAENSRTLLLQCAKLNNEYFRTWSLATLNGAGDEWEVVDPNRQLDANDLAEIQEELNKYGEALDLARQFKTYPKGINKFTLTSGWFDTQLHGHEYASFLADLLEMDAERNGTTTAAREYPLVMLNLERCFANDPLTFVQLTRCDLAVRAVRRTQRLLGMGEPKDLAELQQALTEAAESDRFWMTVRAERGLFHEMYSALERGDHSTTGRRQLTSLANLYRHGQRQPLWWALNMDTRENAPRIPAEHALQLEVFTALLRLQHSPPARQRMEIATLDALQNHYREARVFGVEISRHRVHVLKGLLVMYADFFRTQLRTQAMLRCAVVGVAVERFRQQHGRWPVALDELPKELLPKEPLDPFSDAPLKYVKQDDGVVVYSVGPDVRDDLGNLRNQYRVVPVENDNIKQDKSGGALTTDVGFRLYDPKQRALPPIPLGPNNMDDQVGLPPREVKR